MFVHLLKNRQAFHNAASGFCLFAGADGLAQALEQKKQDTQLEAWRILGAGVMGSFFTGMVYPYAYHVLDKYIPGKTWKAIAAKSGIEIVTVGIFVNSLSMLGRGHWQGTHEMSHIGQHVLTEIPDVTVMDAKIWFPYNVLAFGWIPVAFRPMTTAAMEAGWQTYISLRSHDYSLQEAHSSMESIELNAPAMPEIL